MENLRIYRRHVTGCPLAPEGMNSDIKKCDCPLWMYASENRQPIRRSLKTTVLTRGYERLVRMERNPESLAPAPRSLAAAIPEYLADCRQRGLAESTIRGYKKSLLPLAEFLPGASVRSITADDIIEFRRRPANHQPRRDHAAGCPLVGVKLSREAAAYKRCTCPRKALKAGTLRTRLTDLRVFFKYCIGRKWLDEGQNPSRSLKMPKSDALPTMPFTREEVDRMLRACEQLTGGRQVRTQLRARALLLVLLYTGLRVGDAMKLRRDAVNFETGQVLLRMQKTRVGLYTRLAPEGLAALRALPVESAMYFFWSGDSSLSGRAEAARATIKAVAKRAGVSDAHPHRFRDTFAVELLNNGADIRTVQLLLGHTSLQTTERHYAPFVKGTQRIIDTAVSTLHFGSGGPLLVDPLGDARGNAQHHPRRPLAFAQKSA